MNNKQLFLSITILFSAVSMDAKSTFTLRNLRTEYMNSPIGIDVQTPGFSWQMAAVSPQKGLGQKAYTIRLFDEKGKEVWNSGKIRSAKSHIFLEKRGILQPQTSYIWKLKVWDQKNNVAEDSARFETGLMETTPYQQWGGAKWIGGGDANLPFYAPYLPVFRLKIDFRLDEKSQSNRVSFVYGANDPRLMDANKNIYNIASPKDASYITIMVDTSPLEKGKPAEILVFRKGYSPQDTTATPLKVLSIPTDILNSKNRYQLHNLLITSNQGNTDIYMGKKKIGYIPMNPIGQGGNFLAFPVVGEVGFSLMKGQQLAAGNIAIQNFRSPSNTLAHITYKQADTSRGTVLQLTDPSQNAIPALRTVFATNNKPIRKARLYVTARGIYEMYLNDRTIGKDYFNPGASQYNKTLFYQTFDVTDNINQDGRNVLGARLGEGWWSGGSTYITENWNYFGDRQSLLAQLVITYADGTIQTIATNPATWKYSNDGPVRYSSFFQGEVYDARKEQTGWTSVSYDDKDWQQATEVPLKGTVSNHPGDRNTPRVDDYSQFHLEGQYSPTIQARDTLTATSVKEVRPGVFVYDMGQNMAGVPAIVFRHLPKGATVKMRFAEVTYPNLPAYQANRGMVMMENIRTAMAQDIYITGGNEVETFSPRFTYHGFRYIEITGIPQALPLADVKGVVLSSAERLSSHYETSNQLVNRLWKNITWSTRANFMSLPTDCPQRNERMGWAGDISVFSRSASYLTDADEFLKRYLQDMRDVQRADGRFADIAPQGGGFGGVLWGSAGITIPWECYQQYGDKALLEEHYPAMKRYMNYLKTKNIDSKTNLFVQEKNVWNLGDWLAPQNDQNDNTLLWEAYYLYDLDLMAKMAHILGEENDAKTYEADYQARKTFFQNTYIQPGTGKTVFSKAYPEKEGKLVDTQTSYVLPLIFRLWKDEAQRRLLADNLVKAITRPNKMDDGRTAPPYSLLTGFIGTAWIAQALSENGHSDTAYKLLTQPSYPSWLYPVTQGATTVWERLNSYTDKDGFGGNNSMNSFNHYSFGAVTAWMYSHSLGIQRDEQSPAFQHFILAPEPDTTGNLTFANGYYDAMYGRIRSSWRQEGNKTFYDFSIPTNTSATLRLPYNKGDVILEGNKPYRHYKIIGDKAVMELPAGDYHFNVSTNK